MPYKPSNVFLVSLISIGIAVASLIISFASWKQSWDSSKADVVLVKPDFTYSTLSSGKLVVMLSMIVKNAGTEAAILKKGKFVLYDPKSDNIVVSRDFFPARLRLSRDQTFHYSFIAEPSNPDYAQTPERARGEIFFGKILIKMPFGYLADASCP